ncbi:MAG: GNAT family N-acetyltransferase [Betaproteobacteria bacterium]|jgi:predicted GNAT family N-acyltransferase
MKPAASISVREADWHGDRDILKTIREEVFVYEQGVPTALEWDEFDVLAWHVVALAAGDAIGTGRLLPDGHIGRMAVLRAWRGRGAGSALLTSLMQIARSLGMKRVQLNAQVQALPFYLSHNFRIEGEEFLDAGIAHRRMGRNL